MVHLRRRSEPEPELTPWGFYAVTPAKRRRDPLRALALGTVLALVLTVGGCLAAVGHVAYEYGGAYEVATSPVSVTSREVQTGKAFVLAGFHAARGWTVGRETLGGPTIEGLRVTNTGDHTADLRYAFTFRHGSRWLAEVDCSCPSVEPGRTELMTCFSTTARLPLGYDTVMVADSF